MLFVLFQESLHYFVYPQQPYITYISLLKQEAER